MGTASYVVNFDELSDEIISDVRKGLKNQVNLILKREEQEKLLQEILMKLTTEEYEKLAHQVRAYIDQSQVDGIQKIDGRMLNVPAIANDYIAKFSYNRAVYITGITLNQTGWKKDDQWSLLVDNKKILDHVTIKEVGDHKYFDRKLKVNENTDIKFILHNNNGNSRQLWVDLEYLATALVIPKGVNDIPNDWDIAVVMQWEANSPVDMDLYGVVGDKYAWYGNKNVENLHLNFDYTQHLDNQSPEIMSVAGYKDQILKVYVNNYNSAVLNEAVEISIISRDENKVTTTLKTYSVTIDSNNSDGYYICDVNLDTYKITDKNSIINVGELRK